MIRLLEELKKMDFNQKNIKLWSTIGQEQLLELCILDLAKKKFNGFNM